MRRSGGVIVVAVSLAVSLAVALGSVGCSRKLAQAPAAPIDAGGARPEPMDTGAERAPSADANLDTIEFVPVFFAYDSHALQADAREALDRNARLLASRPGLAITIEGHCDERGTVEYNQALGERRALAARDYLIAAGVDAERIRVVSYGKDRPFAAGHDERAWAQNRRAHTVSGGVPLP